MWIKIEDGEKEKRKGGKDAGSGVESDKGKKLLWKTKKFLSFS